jgi:hypothetical protein
MKVLQIFHVSLIKKYKKSSILSRIQPLLPQGIKLTTIKNMKYLIHGTNETSWNILCIGMATISMSAHTN